MVEHLPLRLIARFPGCLLPLAFAVYVPFVFTFNITLLLLLLLLLVPLLLPITHCTYWLIPLYLLLLLLVNSHYCYYLLLGKIREWVVVVVFWCMLPACIRR